MTPEQAATVFDVLVRHAGASEWQREEFAQMHVQQRCDEFRFQGSLGFGGKFWRRNWTVTCYPEDLTPKRAEVVRVTNAVLAGARAVFVALDEALS